MAKLSAYEVSAAMKNHLFEEYGDYFEDVQSVCPEFSDNDKLRLGVLLENIDDQFDRRFSNMLNEDAVLTAPNVIQGLKTQYMDIVTAVFPNLIADQLFSVQPLQHKVGEIFYLRYIYGTNKDGKTQGQTIFGANEIDSNWGVNNYSADNHKENVVNASLADGAITGVLDYAPVQFETVKITVLADSAAFTYRDDGKGNLILDTATKAEKVGSIEYSTGKFRIFTLATTLEGVEAEYFSSFEDANNEANAPANDNANRIPQIELTVDSVWIEAKPRKLRANYTLDAGYDLQQSQGIDIKEALLQAAAMQLKNEVDGELIYTAYTGAYRHTTWSMAQPSVDPHISRKDYYELFIEHIFQECSQIRQETKRVTGNFLVCGKKAGDILQFIGAPRFVGQNTTTEVGPYYAGLLDGRIKVYINPFMGENQYLIGYKGNNLIDAGLIYAPYLLFFATETVMLDDFLGRRGFMTSYGKKMINNKMYIAGTII